MNEAQVLALLAAAEAGPQPAPSSSPASAPLVGNAAFRAVFDSSGEALVVMDAAGAIHLANPRARELLRLKDANARRAIMADVLPGTPPERLSQLWMQRATAPPSLDTTLASGHPIRVTLRAILPGSQHLLLCLEEGSIVQRAEARWRLLEAELRSVLDSVPAGILLVDLSGRVRFSSVRFGELFGLEAREFAKTAHFKDLAALVAERFRNPASFIAPWEAFSNGHGEPCHDEMEIVRPARRVIEHFCRPVLDGEGRAVGWLELYSDVTGERQIQSKMLQTEKMAALGQLVSGIAHELNNPLTAIMGYAQLLLGRSLVPAHLADVDKVYQEAERARRIVKNLLYFARENKPERTRVDLNEIAERTLALRSYELKVENISVECDLDPALPRTMADPFQLQQVVLNLLVNAEQALIEERGQGHVRISTRHALHGAPFGPRDRIVLELSDDGPGIPREIASRVFDPFFTTKPSGVGTGLGLSIVYGIVEQHGGEITFDSRPGEGTKFIVELPVIAAPAAQRAAISGGRSPEPPAVSAAVPAGRILVVEDEPTVAQLIVDVLREEGHQLEAVLDSQEGLTRLSRSRYDLVICDLRMPRLDGKAFYDALVGAGSPMRSRIIFITGDTLAPRTLEFLEPNNLPYLAKPFLVEELKLAVRRVLEANRGEAAISESVTAAQDRAAANPEG